VERNEDWKLEDGQRSGELEGCRPSDGAGNLCDHKKEIRVEFTRIHGVREEMSDSRLFSRESEMKSPINKHKPTSKALSAVIHSSYSK
jgi:hypothetical protein